MVGVDVEEPTMSYKLLDALQPYIDISNAFRAGDEIDPSNLEGGQVSVAQEIREIRKRLHALTQSAGNKACGSHG